MIKKTGGLCRFDFYMQCFFNGIVKECFDKCQVGNICLKSGLKFITFNEGKVNMILLKTKVEPLSPRIIDYF